jgi:FtsP/CotA-like multicopper oxidase with cupredoxin domain
MKFLALLLSLLLPALAGARAVRYELTATKGTVNLSGKKTVDFALMLNESIPAPTLEFTEGDEAVITLRNHLEDEELSVHWHGLLLPPEMDGVPYVNTPPIGPGESFTFRFPLRQHGTYWYHSHTNVQEQKGLYGAFVIHPKTPTARYDRDLVAVISDWSDEDATQILKNLRKDGDYYLYKKGTVRSWAGAIDGGKLKNFLTNEWTRMGGMDYSDVGYDAFLINGKKTSQGLAAKKGERIRLRIINAGASSYFTVALGAQKLEIISLDGVDVTPVLAKEALVGMAETVDVLFKLPEEMNYELRATAQDGTGFTSLWIGQGPYESAPLKPLPDQYGLMDHQGPTDHEAGADAHEGHGTHGHHQHGGPAVVETFTVADAKALRATAFPTTAPVHDVKLVLSGDMERYVWHINGKAIHQDRNIVIRENEVVRFTFKNDTMMHHPMHLHGHFFRVKNKHGDFSPLKHTVDVPPHGTRTIEFLANEPGAWMLHCHNLYHLKTGMARVVKYSSFTPNKEIREWQKADPHHHDHVYYRGMLEAATNHAQAQLNLMKTWDEVEARAELRNDFSWEAQGDLFYKRWFNRWLALVAGGTTLRGEGAVVGGLSYKLPFLVEIHALVDQRGRMRVDIEKRFQWTKTWYTEADVTLRQKQDSEFEVSLMYQSDWHWSAGLMVTEESAGVGSQYRF